MKVYDVNKLHEISAANISRCRRWHADGQWSKSDWAVAFAGEAGEVCDAVKKLRRFEDGLPGKNPDSYNQGVEAIGEEIADAFIYLDLLCQHLGLNMDEEIKKKFNRVSEELGFPERLGYKHVLER